MHTPSLARALAPGLAYLALRLRDDRAVEQHRDRGVGPLLPVRDVVSVRTDLWQWWGSGWDPGGRGQQA